MGYIQEQAMGSEQVDFGEGDVTIHFRKMNLFEMDLVDKARQKSSVESIVETLMVRARRADGSKFFDKKDRSKIMRQYDPDAVMLIVNAMNAFDAEGTAGN